MTLQERLRACCECEQAPLGPLLGEAADALDAQDERIKALEGALRDAKTILDDVLLDYNEATRNKWRRTAHAWDDRARAMLGEK